MSSFYKTLLLSISALALTNGDSSTNEQGKNVLILMFDDLGRTDLSLFGAEWDTPNLDAFFSDSLMLSHHYIGYFCSASRSTYLTGRHSWHNGYGTLNIFGSLGAVPSAVPNVAEYLKEYGNYKTYAIGKWQLGSATYDHLAYNRGFDYFLGFHGGLEDYITKKSEGYVDFFENLEVSRDYSDEYSTDQYFTKMFEILQERADSIANDDKEDQSPFFMYVGLQANHLPFSKKTKYYRHCLSKYSWLEGDSSYLTERLAVCEAITAVDDNLGTLIELFDSSDEFREMYENTVILITTDNGGDIDDSSCNYPLRGGKATFFDGNQRVLAAVGGGVLPQEQRGAILDGLMSNVDWFPTILAFANLIDKDSSYVSFNDESIATEIQTSLVLDGYNMYNYIMGKDDTSVRDHIVFHLYPRLQDSQYFMKPLSEYTFDDFQDIAMIFYDDDGHLWKYFDVSDDTPMVASMGANAGWCIQKQNDFDSAITSYTYKTIEYDDGSDYSVNVGLFDLATDPREEINLVNDNQDAPLPPKVRDIIEEKLYYYTSVDKNKETLYGVFQCLATEYGSSETLFKANAKKNNAWMPFVSNEEYAELLLTDCVFSDDHPIYSLLTTQKELPSELFDSSMVTSYTKEDVQPIHKRAPSNKQLPKRYYENEFSLDPIRAQLEQNNKDNAKLDVVNVHVSKGNHSLVYVLCAFVASFVCFSLCLFGSRCLNIGRKTASVDERSPLV